MLQYPHRRLRPLAAACFSWFEEATAIREISSSHRLSDGSPLLFTSVAARRSASCESCLAEERNLLLRSTTRSSAKRTTPSSLGSSILRSRIITLVFFLSPTVDRDVSSHSMNSCSPRPEATRCYSVSPGRRRRCRRCRPEKWGPPFLPPLLPPSHRAALCAASQGVAARHAEHDRNSPPQQLVLGRHLRPRVSAMPHSSMGRGKRARREGSSVVVG